MVVVAEMGVSIDLAAIVNKDASADAVDECIRKLEEEKGKIDVFRRELPLCARLLAHVIDVMKKEKRTRGGRDEVEEEDKSNWMSTAQLWTGERSSSSHGAGFRALATPTLTKVARMPDLPFLSKEKLKTPPPSAASRRRQVEQQLSRKSRRCWSQQLHRKFVAVLHQLGGPQVATPKQIRELMNVDGLTSDEVKSHLQKYRLHNRRVPGSPMAKQPIVLAGGLWLVPEESSSQSGGGSPPGPLHLSNSGAVSCEEEDGESYGWK